MGNDVSIYKAIMDCLKGNGFDLLMVEDLEGHSEGYIATRGETEIFATGSELEFNHNYERAILNINSMDDKNFYKLAEIFSLKN